MIFKALFGGGARMEAAYRDVASAHGMTPTEQPLGQSDDWLQQSFVLLPDGDRDRSAVWGLERDVHLVLGGTPVEAQVSAFEWWWEDRRTSRDANGHTNTTWDRQSLVAALVRLPAPADLPGIRVQREGAFSRLGMGGRGDFQVESEEVNRRCDIRVQDPERAIRLFDAEFQSALLGAFVDVTFELGGSWVLVVVGTPSTRVFAGETRRGGEPGIAGWFTRSGDLVRNDEGIVAALPDVAGSAAALLEAFPADFWRAVTGGGA